LLRNSLLERYPDYTSNNGVGLAWALPWDGAKSLDLKELDIFYVEICRRIRLFRNVHRCFYARRATSEKDRISGNERHGVVGDLWIPIKEADERVALNISKHGF
jgi:CRISPR system Cascade subunit CasA